MPVRTLQRVCGKWLIEFSGQDKLLNEKAKDAYYLDATIHINASQTLLATSGSDGGALTYLTRGIRSGLATVSKRLI